MKNSPGKAPAFQFYVKDWLADTELRLTSAATRGIWIDLLCFMWMSKDKGELCISHAGIMKITGATAAEVDEFMVATKNHPFCDISVTESGLSLICNRRMKREEKYRESNRLRQQEHRAKQKCHSDVTEQKVVPPSPSPIPTAKKLLKKQGFILTDEDLKDGSILMIEKALLGICRALKADGIFSNVKSFVTQHVNQGKSKRAIQHALQKTYLKRKFEKGPWSYAEKILKVENGNYNELENRKVEA
jgi:hypothetical protein